MQNRIAKVIGDYDAQGIHRTGSRGDQECARWLFGEALATGAEADLEGMAFRRIDTERCFVDVEGEIIDGVPLFDSPLSLAEGVFGVLGEGGDPRAGIGFLAIPPGSAGGEDFHAYRRRTDHIGIVAVTGGERWNVPPGLALCNAESYNQPYGPTTIQVPTRGMPLLQGAAERRVLVRLVNSGVRTAVEVHNTVARIGGTDPELAPLVVMTPRSGWWECASERGGGIAVWLEMMRAVAASSPARSSEWVASTGHELGHYGLDHYIERRSDLIGEAHAWIHLGANFGAAVGPNMLFQASHDELRSMGVKALDAVGITPARETPVGERPLGEARNVFDGGGRYVSILGGNGLFHHPDDRWPDAVDLETTTAVALAFSRLALNLTRA
ncbi:MAG: hypothetical protein VYE73_04040 [Acidobacteriota bacterium]|nr:hypothetical protein [Acidobacteriota bacterium]